MIDCRDKKYGFGKCDHVEKARGGKQIDIPYFPEPINKMTLVYQSFNQSIEEIYFWLLASLREDSGMHDVKKIKDIFTASEQSAFWGQSQQRLSIQQGQVSNYLATIGKLTKELFQIVREMRILDERLNMYTESYKTIESKSSVFDRKLSMSAEIVLKGYWVDLKDGGVKSPGSVYGLASTLGYTVLPDIFFAAPAMKPSEVDSYVDSLKFNDKVKTVLKRKLKAYCEWKDNTYKEIDNRRRFTLKFLRQHYDAIQMYIIWIKPYMKNVKRLSQSMDRIDGEDLIGSFEGSVTELEVMFRASKSGHHYPVIMLNLLFRTQPHMDFHQDGYQHKGPVHIGRTEFVMRGYTWTEEECSNYLRMRHDEDMELLGDIDESLKNAIDALGDDLRNYLKEAGEKFPEDVKKEEEDKKAEAEAKKKLEQMMGAAEPFIAIFGGFKEIFGALLPKFKSDSKDKGKPSDWEMGKSKKKAEGAMKGALWNTYKNFKKAHRMVTW